MKLAGRGTVALLLVLGALVALGAAPSAEEDEPRCRGRIAEIVGTVGPDDLHGTNERDVIWAGPGDDRVHSALGNDLVCGGSGSDLLHGGRGNDTVDGGTGNADQAIGDLGDDTVMGGSGEFDEAAGSLGIDRVSGGPGSFDLVHGDYGYDRMDGGPGTDDIASFATDVASATGAGVWVSLAKRKARGDGNDRLFRFEDIEGSAFRDVLIGDGRANVIDGGPGDDRLRGGGGLDELHGAQGADSCLGAKGRSSSCGKEPPLKASVYIEVDLTRGGGGGLNIVGGAGNDVLVVAFDEPSSSFGITAQAAIAIGAGCVRVSATQVSCTADPARWFTADLGPGSDKLRVEGSLAGAENVRIGGGKGNDTLRGGPEDDLIESGPGADRLYGEAGADGLVGGLPGPTFIYGGEDGDLMAAGGGCAGGAIVGGPGRDDASFAETQAHPGLLIISFPQDKAWIDVVRGCDSVRLDDSNEDMEGSFDWDVLIGDSGPNAMLGQPGEDEFYGNGGDDIIDARDGYRDFVIQCGAGRYVRPPKAGPKAKPRPPVLVGTPAGRALMDPFDPGPQLCAEFKYGDPVAGLNNSG
jgi:Ca2+-binding RTX toxin-like protein